MTYQKHTYQNLHLILLLIGLSITIKLTSNIIFFRQAYLSGLPVMGFTIASSAIIYPLFYIVNDLILSLTNKKFAIITVLSVTICNGIFAYYISSITLIPDYLPWKLFINDIVGMTVTNLFELLFFNYIINKINNFFLSAFLSVSFTLSLHNFMSYYFTLGHTKNWFAVYFHSLIIEISTTFAYLLITQLTILKRYNLSRKFLKQP